MLYVDVLYDCWTEAGGTPLTPKPFGEELRDVFPEQHDLTVVAGVEAPVEDEYDCEVDNGYGAVRMGWWAFPLGIHAPIDTKPPFPFIYEPFDKEKPVVSPSPEDKDNPAPLEMEFLGGCPFAIVPP